MYENLTSCVWNVSLATRYACVDYTYTESSSKDGNNNDDLSGGSVFIIIVLVWGFIYVSLGFLYNSFKHGRTGMEALPNHHSWKMCCAYTKAGCQVTAECLTCGRVGAGSATGVTLLE